MLRDVARRARGGADRVSTRAPHAQRRAARAAAHAQRHPARARARAHHAEVVVLNERAHRQQRDQDHRPDEPVHHAALLGDRREQLAQHVEGGDLQQLLGKLHRAGRVQRAPVDRAPHAHERGGLARCVRGRALLRPRARQQLAAVLGRLRVHQPPQVDHLQVLGRAEPHERVHPPHREAREDACVLQVAQARALLRRARLRIRVLHPLRAVPARRAASRR